MPVSTQTQRIGRFVDPWSHIALGAFGLVLLAFLVAQFFHQRLFSETVYVEPEDFIQLESIQLQSQLIGALRIDVKAWLSTNTWVIYEIQIRDQNGEVIASAMKEAWSESGKWREGTQSGTWYESDLQGRLDVKAKKNEKITVAIAVLEYGNTSGQELEKPVRFDMTVANGVVDTRYLLLGLIGSGILGILAMIPTLFSGEVAIAKTIRGSHLTGGARVGRADQLVRVKVDVEADTASPSALKVRLVINDTYGKPVYVRILPMFLTRPQKSDHKVGQVQCFFILEPRSLYAFHLAVKPDASVNRTTLTVRDRNRTFFPVEVVHIRPSFLRVSDKNS